MIKAVVAGDWVTGRIPYRPPIKFKSFAKHYLAMNEVPSIDDSSYGMWRRVYVIEFPKTFSPEEMDVHLKYILEATRRAFEGNKQMKIDRERLKTAERVGPGCVNKERRTRLSSQTS